MIWLLNYKVAAVDLNFNGRERVYMTILCIVVGHHWEDILARNSVLGRVEKSQPQPSSFLRTNLSFYF